MSVQIPKVFDFQDYKAYLHAAIEAQPQKRGFRSRMAELMKCQPSFITRVLGEGSSVDFSLEQAESVNDLLGHSLDEASYFLLLVQYARAGTSGLRNHVREQMKQILNRRLKFSKEMESRSVLSAEDHMKYFSAWYYSAFRVAVSIPQLQTVEALSKRFSLPISVVTEVLDFLRTRGFVEQKGNRFSTGSQHHIGLDSEHPMVNRHHVNWRARAMTSLDTRAATDLHYSYVVTLSEVDALKIRSFLVDTIKELMDRAAPSKEEVLYAVCLDFFEP